MKRFCVVGTGSMGQRHIKNLNIIFSKRKEEVEIDVFRSSTKALDPELEGLITRELYQLEDLAPNYDAIIIANPTAKHYSSLLTLIERADFFLIEKPIFDSKNYDTSRFFEKNIYVACPLRHSKVIQEVKLIAKAERILYARAISSSYLPDWRPNTDYRENYSAKRKLGGGVGIDLIHEWDYIIELFGYPQNLFSIMAKNSNLEIETNDVAEYIAKYPDIVVSLHLDYFGRKARRELELFTENDTIIADLINNSIKWLNAGRTVCLEDSRDDYQLREMEYFLDIVEGKKKNINSIERALNTLQIARGEW